MKFFLKRQSFFFVFELCLFDGHGGDNDFGAEPPDVSTPIGCQRVYLKTGCFF